jgi:hypothetical protein
MRAGLQWGDEQARGEGGDVGKKGDGGERGWDTAERERYLGESGERGKGWDRVRVMGRGELIGGEVEHGKNRDVAMG